MLRTAGTLVAIFGTIFGGAYVLDRVAKFKEKLIEEQENDEVELDDFEPEDIDWYQMDLMEYLAEQQKCCGNCKCGQHDADGDRECCGNCENCKCHENDEENK